jgi:four helix bundle protein
MRNPRRTLHAVVFDNLWRKEATSIALNSSRTTASGHRDLKVYQLAYKLAMEIFRTTKTFPEEERYSLTSQIRRSSRSVAANIAEGYRKRQYPSMFASKLADCDAEATETQVWLDFARDCEYLSDERHQQLQAGYGEIGRMLSSMMANPGKFSPR